MKALISAPVNLAISSVCDVSSVRTAQELEALRCISRTGELPVTTPQGEVRFTQHAQQRCQQRGIETWLVDIVLRYGRWRRTRGGYSCSLDGRARERARRGLGDVTYQRIADRLDFYIGVAEDRCTVLTVAHRLRRQRSR